ncbi:MAG: hypothetical protein JNM62_03180 [Flavobacteriales bacterium]|nr:hypothetical protein [Flavobacteriales bacterium]
MRALYLILLSCNWSGLFAQVELDKALRFVGADDQRRVDGLAYPATHDAALTVGVSASGALHWASATAYQDTFLLTTTPTISTVNDGLLLRFIPSTANSGPSWISVDGSNALPLLRPDGLPVAPGELRTAHIVEAIHVGDHWTFINTSHTECPTGSVAVNDRFCIETGQTPTLGYYAAIQHCGERGGKLCTWGEYVAACSVAGSGLSGLFDAWEWLDDTANHTHTALQAGRLTCQSERSANTFDVGDARCCYHPR